MWYSILPNILFLFAILGIIVLVLRRLPEATALDSSEQNTNAQDRLKQKGVPVEQTSAVKAFLLFWSKRVWQFLLEAKDIRHTGVVQYRIKQMFQKTKPVAQSKVIKDPQAVPVEEAAVVESQDEVYYLEKIKHEPKNLQRYNALGNFYLHVKNYADAQSVYEYLTKYDPTNSTHWARLAFVKLSRGLYNEAVQDYLKALSLDPTHPSRYYNLGLAYKALGKWKESAEQFGRACELDPDNVKYKGVRDYALTQIKS